MATLTCYSVVGFKNVYVRERRIYAMGVPAEVSKAPPMSDKVRDSWAQTIKEVHARYPDRDFRGALEWLELSDLAYLLET